MIRIDYKKDKSLGYVATTWVREVEDGSSMIGRLLFTEDEFKNLQELTETPFGPAYKWEEKG